MPTSEVEKAPRVLSNSAFNTGDFKIQNSLISVLIRRNWFRKCLNQIRGSFFFHCLKLGIIISVIIMALKSHFCISGKKHLDSKRPKADCVCEICPIWLTTQGFVKLYQLHHKGEFVLVNEFIG